MFLIQTTVICICSSNYDVLKKCNFSNYDVKKTEKLKVDPKPKPKSLNNELTQ